MNFAIPRYDARQQTVLQVLDKRSRDIQETDVDYRDEVSAIVSDVRTNGDRAVLQYTGKFDGLTVDSVARLRLSPEDLRSAYESLSEADRGALTDAAQRIRSFHERQVETGFEHCDEYGNRIGQRVRPIDRVGLYIPGGQAAYPSTVLMTALPAHVAGVREIIVTVPTPANNRNPLVLAALHLAEVDEVFTVGGAQAIAAMAYGTATIPRVDKIVGPGGVFASLAKRLVFGDVGIDVIAGPSEVLIIADGSCSPRWAALDLLAQAEHDRAASALLASTSSTYLDEVEQEVNAVLSSLSRADIARDSLQSHGALILCRDFDQCVEVANTFAPEHLELAVAEPEKLVDAVENAGAIFLGSHSAEVMGDYSAGPSHVLPTSQTARFSSPLGVYDFVKRSSIISLTAEGADALARTAAHIADAEGLTAHGAAARARIQGYDDNRNR